MYRLLIPHIKPSVREIMIKSHWAPGLSRDMREQNTYILASAHPDDVVKDQWEGSITDAAESSSPDLREHLQHSITITAVSFSVISGYSKQSQMAMPQLF